MNKNYLWAVGCVIASLFIAFSVNRCVNTKYDTGGMDNATSTVSDNYRVATPNTSYLEIPDYLGHVWPEASSNIDVDDYSKSVTTSTTPMGRGIGAEINGAEIDIDFSDGASIVLPQRLTLIVDGVVAPNDTLVFADGLQKYDLYIDGKFFETKYVGPYYVSWAIGVEPGQHVVELQMEQDSGALLVYKWEFVVVDSEK